MKRSEYEDLKHLIDAGHIKDIGEVFKRIQPQLWYADMGITYKTYAKRREAPGTFKAEEIIRLGDKLDVDPVKIFSLINASLQASKKKAKR